MYNKFLGPVYEQFRSEASNKCITRCREQPHDRKEANMKIECFRPLFMLKNNTGNDEGM